MIKSFVSHRIGNFFKVVFVYTHFVNKNMQYVLLSMNLLFLIKMIGLFLNLLFLSRKKDKKGPISKWNLF